VSIIEDIVLSKEDSENLLNTLSNEPEAITQSFLDAKRRAKELFRG
jgi:hypothetical protein